MYFPEDNYNIVTVRIRMARTRGLVGFILALMGLAPIGIYFSRAAARLYDDVGRQSDGITVAGEVLNIIGIVAWAIVITVLFLRWGVSLHF